MEIFIKVVDYLCSSPEFLIFTGIACIMTCIDMLNRERKEIRMNKENLVIRLPEEVKNALAGAAYITGSTMSQKAREYIIERLTEEGHLEKRGKEKKDKQ